MRFMVIVKANPDSEAGVMASPEMLEKMGAYNNELIAAGVMLDGAGLRDSSQGVRVSFDGPAPVVMDGPFAETKELVAGYWIIQAKNLAEAVEWMKRCPNPHEDDGEIEIRQLFELEDFGESPAFDHHRRLEQELKS